MLRDSTYIKVRDQTFSSYAKLSKKLASLKPSLAQVGVLTREIIVLGKFLRTHYTDVPQKMFLWWEKSTNNPLTTNVPIIQKYSRYIYFWRGDNSNVWLIYLLDYYLSGSKLYSTFPKNLAKINGIKIFRSDRNRFGKGLILYVNEQVPCKLFSRNSKLSDLQNLILEFYRNNRKWLFLVA